MKYSPSSSSIAPLPLSADIFSTWRDAPPMFTRPSDNLDAWLTGMRTGLGRFNVEPSVWTAVAAHYYLGGDVKASLNYASVRWPQSWIDLEIALRMYVLGAKDREHSVTPKPNRGNATTYERWFETSKNRLMDREALERLQSQSGGTNGERLRLAFARATYDALRSASAHSGTIMTSPAFGMSGSANYVSTASFTGRLVWPTAERALRMYCQGHTYCSRVS